MSLPPRTRPSDYERFMNQYLANLNQDIQNQTLVYNAVSANLSGDFADVPQMPQDNRSVEDKLRDIDSLKTQLRPLLMSLTDGATANEIVKTLDDTPDLLQVAIQSFPTLYQSLKPLWSMGVPAVVFIQAVENVKEKIDQTAGIDPAVNAYRSGLMSQIPYVAGIETDRLARENLIEQARQEEEVLAQEREDDRLQGEANLQQAQEDLAQLQRENAAISRIRRAKEGVKKRREELAQIEAQQQQQQQAQQAPPLGLSSLQVPAEAKSSAAEAIARVEAKAKARTPTPQASQSQEPVEAPSPTSVRTNISGITDTGLSMTTQPTAQQLQREQKPISYLKSNLNSVLSGLTETKGESFDGRSKAQRRSDILNSLQDGVKSTGSNITYKVNNTGLGISINDMVTGNLPSGKILDSEKRNPEYWNQFNIAEMFETYKKPAPEPKKRGETLGSGFRRRTMSGRGVSFNITEDEKAKPSPKKTIKLNIAGVIEKEPSYVPFGRYAINKHRLAGDILMLRTPKNGVVLKLPTQKISSKLSKIITTVANKGVPSFEAIGELDTNDKEILHKILQESHIQNISTPNPSRDKDDDMYRRFVILKGEIVAGNSNPALAKELKRLIVILMSKDLLPKREGTAALVELALLEM